MRRVAKAALPSSIYTRTGAPKLVLVTCGGPFDARAGHYRDNIIVTAVRRCSGTARAPRIDVRSVNPERLRRADRHPLAATSASAPTRGSSSASSSPPIWMARGRCPLRRDGRAR